MKFLRDIIEEKRAARAGDDAPTTEAAERPVLDIPSVSEAMAEDMSDPEMNGSADEMDFDLKSLEPIQSYDDDEGWVGAETPEGAEIKGDVGGLHDMFADTESDEVDMPAALNLEGFEVKQDADVTDEAEAEEPSLPDALEAAVADLETLRIEAEPGADDEFEAEAEMQVAEDVIEDTAEAEDDRIAVEMSDEMLDMEDAEIDAAAETEIEDDLEADTTEVEMSDDAEAGEALEVQDVEADAVEVGQDEAAIALEDASEMAPEVEAVTEALMAEEASDETANIASVEDAEVAPEPVAQEAAAEVSDAPFAVPLPAAGRGAGGRSGRVKTRILGFTAPAAASEDPFEKAGGTAKPTDASASFPVGWLVVVDGPGRGAAFTIFDGVTQIGRGEDQTVRLNFGDNSISRENHAAIAYDNEQQTFFIGHGGKANLVRVNNRPVLSTEELQSDDTVRIGETTLRFVAFCGAKFSWDRDEDVKHASAQ
ncbi:FHA domain-containing protein [Roseovarius rhodophyticola]|uniref:FHA domain-containing protein n=1 Tax=Roseovarius rhodophyticola TaxID=3080827 RepID=A0ABZ2TG38_9RHOB|nr:FHA domain-containing protein [Roseovarius sp. W115]MDV2928929.1 FHA domain-containing protein [Roseovarius sp. W115]